MATCELAADVDLGELSAAVAGLADMDCQRFTELVAGAALKARGAVDESELAAIVEASGDMLVSAGLWALVLQGRLAPVFSAGQLRFVAR